MNMLARAALGEHVSSRNERPASRAHYPACVVSRLVTSSFKRTWEAT